MSMPMDRGFGSAPGLGAGLDDAQFHDLSVRYSQALTLSLLAIAIISIQLALNLLV